MKTKPILFNTEMVQAILEGRKTQTRRAVKNKVADDGRYEGWRDKDVEYIDGQLCLYTTLARTIKSKYKIGDILYVKETWTYGRVVGENDDYGNSEFLLEQLQEHEDKENIFYKADMQEAINEGVSFEDVFWKPSIHMPKKYARIFLKVTKVRVERLQDMKNNDYLLEGVDKNLTHKYLEKKYPQYIGKYSIDKIRFIELWNSTSKDGYKWEDNPFVFVYEFKKVENEK